MMSFSQPWILLLLLGVPLVLWLRRDAAERALVHSRAGTASAFAGRAASVLAVLPRWLRIGAVVAGILALAGPRTGEATIDDEAEGIAIMLVVDVSSSMLAEDFEPLNRMAVARQKAAEFVASRNYDRIGLVAFAGEALTLVPLTVDYPVIYQGIEQLQAGVGLVEDGTAIGTAIATAANRLRRAPGESKVMVLLTDGENNRGEIDPLTAARAAVAYGIRIHTIAVGTEGVARIPVARGPFGVQYASLPVSIDEELLQEVADMSGGRYFRATDPASLEAIYEEIDELETVTVAVQRHVRYTPRELPFILFACLALMLEWGVRGSRWGRVP
jgi:Ca-activated chloride channel homolog